ncbi:MAG: helix-turn-helix transcriptional regulator [Flavobacteriia bacterium]
MIDNTEQKLKQLRELKNYTQEFVAAQMGLTTRAYSKIESGDTKLTINRLNEISKILEIDPISILEFDHNHVFNACNQDDDDEIVEENNEPRLTKKLIDQYEQRIQHLEGEVLFLRNLVK